MNLAEIENAMANNQKVYWATEDYQLVKDSIIPQRYLLVCNRGLRGEVFLADFKNSAKGFFGYEDKFFVKNNTKLKNNTRHST